MTFTATLTNLQPGTTYYFRAVISTSNTTTVVRADTKSFTTSDDQSRGVLEGLDRVAADADLSLQQLLAKTDLIIHGTTTADNTMIELSGSKTGLLVTAGARDEIELRRGWKEDIWDPTAPPPGTRRRRIISGSATATARTRSFSATRP